MLGVTVDQSAEAHWFLAFCVIVGWYVAFYLVGSVICYGLFPLREAHRLWREYRVRRDQPKGTRVLWGAAISHPGKSLGLGVKVGLHAAGLLVWHVGLGVTPGNRWLMIPYAEVLPDGQEERAGLLRPRPRKAPAVRLPIRGTSLTIVIRSRTWNKLLEAFPDPLTRDGSSA